MNERLYILDRSGVEVNDPWREAEYATGLNWETNWPGGYGSCSFSVRRDIAARWAVKQAYEIIVRDGNQIVYQGRLGDLTRLLMGTEESIEIDAAGWIVSLAERYMRKRWIDNAPVTRFYWPTNSDTQLSFSQEKRDDFLKVQLAQDAIDRAGTESYHERYDMPAGMKARRVTFDYKIRTGEGGRVALYNIDTSSEVYGISNGPPYVDVTGSGDHTFATHPNQFNVSFSVLTADTYDPRDFIFIDNALVYGALHTSHSHYASPTYHADEIVEDVLLTIGSDISVDYDGLTDPGYVLNPFITEGDDYETGMSIIERAAAFGDSSQNTWGFCVWDETGASDGKPKATFGVLSTSDYEYEVRLGNLSSFREDENDEGVINYVVVKYKDELDRVAYRTPADNAGLQDTASIASYGQRERMLNISYGGATVADYVGARYIAYHKDPQRSMTASIAGQIRNKGGVWSPASHVRAGQRVRVLDYRGGQTYFLRHTSYDAESGELEMNSQPPDAWTIFTQQREEI